MRVYEFGTEQEKAFAMFQCAAEPWWVFEASAKELARDYHVYLFIADGHDEQGTTFISIEKNVEDAAAYLKENGGPAPRRCLRRFHGRRQLDPLPCHAGYTCG